MEDIEAEQGRGIVKASCGVFGGLARLTCRMDGLIEILKQGRVVRAISLDEGISV